MHKSNCQQIVSALKLCFKSGNSVREVSEGWTIAKKVFHMNGFLSDKLKNEINEKVAELEYWKDEGSPHFPPDEGFFCNKCKEGISFPVKK